MLSVVRVLASRSAFAFPVAISFNRQFPAQSAMILRGMILTGNHVHARDQLALDQPARHFLARFRVGPDYFGRDFLLSAFRFTQF